VAISNGGALQLLPSGTGTLLGVRLNGDLSMPTNAHLQFLGDSSIAAGHTIHMTGAGALLELGAVAGLNVSFENPSGTSTARYAADNWVIPADAVFRTAGGSGQVALSNGTLTNQGTLISQTAGKTLFVGSSAPANQNLMRVIDGTMQVTRQLNNTGTIDVKGGVFLANLGITGPGPITISGGTLTLGGQTTADARAAIQQSGGIVNVIGNVDNSNATISLS